MGLIVILIFAALVLLGAGVYGVASRPSPSISKDDLTALRMRNQYNSDRADIAEQGLRQIANGDSMPVLTAGDYLDRINRKKEIA